MSRLSYAIKRVFNEDANFETYITVFMDGVDVYTVDLESEIGMFSDDVGHEYASQLLDVQLTKTEYEQICSKIKYLYSLLKKNRLFLSYPICIVRDARFYVMNDGMFEYLREDCILDAINYIYRHDTTLEVALLLNPDWTKR